MAGPPELRSRTARISADLARARIRHAISEAVAMTAHGVGGSTFDIDILVVAPSVRLPEVFALIRRHGFAGNDRELLESLRDRYVAALEGGPKSSCPSSPTTRRSWIARCCVMWRACMSPSFRSRT